MKKKKIESVGFGSNGITRDLNRALGSKIGLTTKINDDWRDAIESDPDLERKTTYITFRKEWLKKERKKKKR
jgi:hypothetical protein